MSFKQTMFKLGMSIKKHSPAILTGVGIVGLGATAYLAYKSKDKVEAAVEKIEMKRDLEQPIDKMEVAKDLTEALYLPVTVGAASIACIFASYRIQNNRIAMLAGALAVEQTRTILFEKKYRDKHGDEEYAKFVTPTDEVERIEVDAKGKEKITKESVKKDIDHTIGQWYDESSEYASDDHQYNISMIDSAQYKMETILFQRGTILLNEVREALGFERIRNGALLGWSGADHFEIIKHISIHKDEETGEMKEHIWVTWTRPRYVYGDMEFNGRYAVYGNQ